MRFATLIGALAGVVVAFAAVSAAPDDAAAPFPAGESKQTLGVLSWTIEMPDAWDPAAEHSLLVILHGNGGTDDGMARSMMHLTKEGFVVAAPKSRGLGWETAGDIDCVRTVAADLRKKLRVGERRMHVAGFSNGGWNLAPVAFDEALRCQSACWVAAGCRAGKPPKHAKKEMGVLALAGTEDGNRDAAAATVPFLADKVRTAEVRLQPGLGHAWPDRLVPYFTWWILVQEGRFTPGWCAAFDWKASPAEALSAGASEKKGAFVLWWSAADTANEKAKTLENDVMREALVQRFGQQLVCAKASREESAEEWAKTGLKTTPAVVVYDAVGKVKAALQDRIDGKALSAALRSVAADRSIPKE